MNDFPLPAVFFAKPCAVDVVELEPVPFGSREANHPRSRHRTVARIQTASTFTPFDRGSHPRWGSNQPRLSCRPDEK